MPITLITVGLLTGRQCLTMYNVISGKMAVGLVVLAMIIITDQRERASWAIVVSFSSAVLGSELVGMGCLISNVDYC